LETVKGLIATQFDGALVAGRPHAEYMKQLGLAPEAIQIVGNCVDNEFFSNEAARIRALERAQSTGRPSYFLYVGRFIPEKNLPFLLRSYARYREAARADAVGLVLVGSGPEEGQLRSLVDGAKISGIDFAGNRQADELPSFYASACCLILPSTSEPWGLVVNEAMASGLPVLASKACGCVEDLVVPGQTGYVFDSDDEHALAELMHRIAVHDEERADLGRAAREKVQSMHVDLYAGRVVQHVKRVLDQPVGSQRGGFRSRLVRHLTGVLSVVS
jgi:glycosyltransferase involved in cell wall biosynthesis